MLVAVVVTAARVLPESLAAMAAMAAAVAPVAREVLGVQVDPLRPALKVLMRLEGLVVSAARGVTPVTEAMVLLAPQARRRTSMARMAPPAGMVVMRAMAEPVVLRVLVAGMHSLAPMAVVVAPACRAMGAQVVSAARVTRV